MVVTMADMTVIGSLNKENVGCSVENTQMMNNSNIIQLFINLFSNYLISIALNAGNTTIYIRQSLFYFLYLGA